MAFAAGQPLSANDLNMTGLSSTDGTTRTTTSTSYTTTLSPAGLCGVAFTGPPSGKVLISWATSLSNNTSPNIAQCSPGIRVGSTVGSGTVFQAAGGFVHLTSTANVRIGASTIVSGLTPGTVYNVALEHRAIAAGTASFDGREVLVVPLLS